MTGNGDGTKTLIAALISNTSVKSINLSCERGVFFSVLQSSLFADNEIGAQALAELLKKNTTIVDIDLHCERFSFFACRG